MIKALISAIIITFVPIDSWSGHTPYSRHEEYSRVRPPVSAKCGEWWNLAQSVGWAGYQLPMLDRIIWRESRCYDNVHNPSDPNGGSFGLVQINGFWVKYLSEAGLLTDSSDLFDPEINLRSALAIYNYAHAKHGKGWSPWGFHKET